MNDYEMINYLEVREIDLRREIGEAKQIVKLLEGQLREITKEKNRIKTKVENVPYFPK